MFGCSMHKTRVPLRVLKRACVCLVCAGLHASMFSLLFFKCSRRLVCTQSFWYQQSVLSHGCNRLGVCSSTAAVHLNAQLLFSLFAVCKVGDTLSCRTYLASPSGGSNTLGVRVCVKKEVHTLVLRSMHMHS